MIRRLAARSRSNAPVTSMSEPGNQPILLLFTNGLQLGMPHTLRFPPQRLLQPRQFQRRWRTTKRRSCSGEFHDEKLLLIYPVASIRCSNTGVWFLQAGFLTNKVGGALKNRFAACRHGVPPPLLVMGSLPMLASCMQQITITEREGTNTRGEKGRRRIKCKYPQWSGRMRSSNQTEPPPPESFLCGWRQPGENSSSTQTSP